MTLLVVRHAKAGDRDAWEAPDELRPLTAPGRAQADGLVEALRDFDVGRVLSSPYVRCTQTVEPLAARLGRAVEPCAELAEGNGDAAARLVAALAATATSDLVSSTHGDIVLRTHGDIVLCTHGDVALDILDDIARTGAALPPRRPLKKGSTWVLAVEGGRVVEARYLDPPVS
jgi:8-oxo-dGTP diphosphatase